MKHLGIDYGTRRIGIAVSNDEGTIAFPKGILNNDTSLLDNIVALIHEENIKTIVIGKSIDIDGNDNQVMDRIHSFISKLEEVVKLPIYFQDESFSSVAADAHLYGKGNIANESWTGQGNQARREANDDRAAAIILQRYLDKQK
ncbi:Holliday junction resolvase RuvX [Patescibacteria group bacterium]|nr:Holliday junction resolvase RuvX [Patescibacteria group bacterium]